MTTNPDTIFASVLRHILKPLIDRLDAQDARIAALEQRPIGVVDGGVYQTGKVYAQGTGVTLRGAYWIARCETRREPADENNDWRLIVRQGKRGREGPRGKDGAPCRCAAREQVAS